MFTVEGRASLQATLIGAARTDARIDAAALVGSGAVGREDAWSDIDLALRVAPTADRSAVIEDWTDLMYREHAAVHHFDVTAGAIYRVFLLASTLQVDLSFWAPDEFTARGPKFRLLFGTAGVPRVASNPDLEELVGTT